MSTATSAWLCFVCRKGKLFEHSTERAIDDAIDGAYKDHQQITSGCAGTAMSIESSQLQDRAYDITFYKPESPSIKASALAHVLGVFYSASAE